MSNDRMAGEGGRAIVSWAKQSYQLLSSDHGDLPDVRVDLIALEPLVDDMWQARLAIADGRFDIIVTFWLDDTHHLIENRLHVEEVQYTPGTSVPPLYSVLGHTTRVLEE